MGNHSDIVSDSPLYLLDTNILVHYIRRDRLGREIEARYGLLLTPTVPLISIVTEGELRASALKFGWGAEKMDQLEFLLTCLARVSLEEPGLLNAYATIDAYSESVGISIGKNDVWIAATVYITGARLLTTDKDFDHLSPLFVESDWIDPMMTLDS